MASLSLDEPNLESVVFEDEVQNVEAVNVELNALLLFLYSPFGFYYSMEQLSLCNYVCFFML
ncbi:hypothetical protein LguiA_025574 [Lonicera macranthoides]